MTDVGRSSRSDRYAGIVDLRRGVAGGLRYARVRTGYAARDARSWLRYGSDGPLVAERIVVDPMQVEFAVRCPGFADTGELRSGDWDLDTAPVEEIDRVQFCRQHFVEGKPWDETGAYVELIRRIRERRDDRVTVDGCASEQDVIERYAALDTLYHEARTTGTLRTRAELGGRSFRENYGLVIHIGRHNQPLFSWHGCHRLAIARILELPAVPAQLGVVHTDARTVWRERYSPTSAPVRKPFRRSQADETPSSTAN